MAIIGITLDQQTAYQSKADPAIGTDEATTFQLGTLDSRIIGKLRDDATSFAVNPNAPEEEVDVSIGQNELYYLAAQFGIKGWTKLKDADGNDIKFRTRKRNVAGRTYEIVDDATLSRIPQGIIVELGREVLDANEVTETEAKN